MHNRLFLFLMLCLAATSCKQAAMEADIASPNGDLKVHFFSTREGGMAYQVRQKETLVVDTSFLGFSFKGMDPMQERMLMIGTQKKTIDTTWVQPWGEQKQIRNHCNELTIQLQESLTPRRMMNIVFRVFDDGLGFRYEFPEQANIASAVITNEITQFNMVGEHAPQWFPSDDDSSTQLSTINAPLAVKTSEGLNAIIYEANLKDYPAMTLGTYKDSKTLFVNLVSSPDGTKAKLELPFNTPWRTIELAGRSENLLNSNLILNLSDLEVMEDSSWVNSYKGYRFLLENTLDSL